MPRSKIGVVCAPSSPDWATHTVVSLSSSRRPSTSTQNTSPSAASAAVASASAAPSTRSRARENCAPRSKPSTVAPGSAPAAATTFARSASGYTVTITLWVPSGHPFASSAALRETLYSALYGPVHAAPSAAVAESWLAPPLYGRTRNVSCGRYV
jgi:hypothetical protein